MQSVIKWNATVVLMGLLFIGSVPTVKGGPKYAGGDTHTKQVPTKISEVDTANHTLKIVTGRGKVEVYTVTAFTQFFVDGKPAKFEELQKGMIVDVSGSISGATRVNATSTTQAPVSAVPGQAKK